MFNKELFVKSHWAQAITVGVVVIFVVSWNVILEDTNIFGKKETGKIKGESIINESQNQNETKAVLEYQAKIKKIVSDYLLQRSKFNEPHQDWLFLANNTKYKILPMEVPLEYKELHTQIIVTLDTERKAVSLSNSEKIRYAGKKWEEILEQYFWLNQ